MQIVKIKIRNSIRNSKKNNIKNQINWLNNQRIMVHNQKKHLRVMIPIILRRAMHNKSNKLMNQLLQNKSYPKNKIFNKINKFKVKIITRRPQTKIKLTIVNKNNNKKIKK